MKRCCLLAFVFALCFLLTGCEAKSARDIVSEALELNISEFEEITNIDTHGGFLGDGTTNIVLRIPDDSLQEQILKSGKWKQLPMNETAQTLAHSGYTSKGLMASLLRDDEYNDLLPIIQNGYYILIDRQREKKTGIEDEGEILNRYSYNFTLAIYDTDEQLLHFCERDT